MITTAVCKQYILARCKAVSERKIFMRSDTNQFSNRNLNLIPLKYKQDVLLLSSPALR